MNRDGPDSVGPLLALPRGSGYTENHNSEAGFMNIHGVERMRLPDIRSDRGIVFSGRPPETNHEDSHDTPERIAFVFRKPQIPDRLWRMIENKIIFRRAKGDPWQALRDPALKSRITQVWFPAADGARLNGWYVPAEPGKPTVVFAHGNGKHMADANSPIRAFTDRGYGFLAFDYRGYGKSQGKPSEAGVYRDFEAASRFLVSHGVPVRDQVALGESLGGGVVIEAATRLPFRAVMVYSTFTAVSDVVSNVRKETRWGKLVPDRIARKMRGRFDSVKKVHRLQSPLLIVGDGTDRLIPDVMSQKLYEAAEGTDHKKLVLVPDADHNNVFVQNADRLIGELEALMTQKHTQG